MLNQNQKMITLYWIALFAFLMFSSAPAFAAGGEKLEVVEIFEDGGGHEVDPEPESSVRSVPLPEEEAIAGTVSERTFFAGLINELRLRALRGVDMLRGCKSIAHLSSR